MSRFIKITITLIIILLLFGCGAVQLVEAYSVSYDGTTFYTLDDMYVLKETIDQQEINMEAAHQLAEAARTLGYSENHTVIILAKQEYEEANTKKEQCLIIYNDLKEYWQIKEKEYPTAAYIWSYLKESGYNNYVAAGILGNIMTEVGGNTLDIRACAYGSGFYGMCQWSKSYSDVWGTSLEEQCDFLRDTIEYELNTYGYAYKKGFNYASFLELEDCEKTAKAFAKAYERCASSSYKVRQENAITAYNYFVG